MRKKGTEIKINDDAFDAGIFLLFNLISNK